MRPLLELATSFRTYAMAEENPHLPPSRASAGPGRGTACCTSVQSDGMHIPWLLGLFVHLAMPSHRCPGHPYRTFSGQGQRGPIEHRRLRRQEDVCLRDDLRTKPAKGRNQCRNAGQDDPEEMWMWLLPPRVYFTQAFTSFLQQLGFPRLVRGYVELQVVRRQEAQYLAIVCSGRIGCIVFCPKAGLFPPNPEAACARSQPLGQAESPGWARLPRPATLGRLSNRRSTHRTILIDALLRRWQLGPLAPP
jgi:hypothetical protein